MSENGVHPKFTMSMGKMMFWSHQVCGNPTFKRTHHVHIILGPQMTAGIVTKKWGIWYWLNIDNCKPSQLQLTPQLYVSPRLLPLFKCFHYDLPSSRGGQGNQTPSAWCTAKTLLIYANHKINDSRKLNMKAFFHPSRPKASSMFTNSPSLHEKSTN